MRRSSFRVLDTIRRMSRKDLFAKVCTQQIVGVVREDSAEAALAVADAYAHNGITIIEVTFTTPDAIELMATVARTYGPQGITVAAGPVPDLVRTHQWEEIGRRALLATSIIQSRRTAVAPEMYVH